MPAPSIMACAPLPADLLAPEAVTTVAARTCLLEGPAFDAISLDDVDSGTFIHDVDHSVGLGTAWCSVLARHLRRAMHAAAVRQSSMSYCDEN